MTIHPKTINAYRWSVNRWLVFDGHIQCITLRNIFHLIGATHLLRALVFFFFCPWIRGRRGESSVDLIRHEEMFEPENRRIARILNSTDCSFLVEFLGTALWFVAISLLYPWTPLASSKVRSPFDWARTHAQRTNTIEKKSTRPKALIVVKVLSHFPNRRQDRKFACQF